MNEFVKDLKIKKHFDTPDPTIPKFTEEDFKEAAKGMSSLYNEAVEIIYEEKSKLLDLAIFDCCREYLGCKSADDVYNLMTTGSFVRFNEIIPLVNDCIKAYVGLLGPYFETLKFKELDKPLEKSEEMLKLYRERWDVLYNNEEENTDED